MHKQRGASTGMIVTLIVLAVAVAAYLAMPYISTKRNEHIEKELNRGVPPAKVDAKKAEEIERAQNVELAESVRGFKTIQESEHYRALSAACRGIIDDHVALLDRPADASTDMTAVRSRAAELERRFQAECV